MVERNLDNSSIYHTILAFARSSALEAPDGRTAIGDAGPGSMFTTRLLTRAPAAASVTHSTGSS